jgi:hypothetical protein
MDLYDVLKFYVNLNKHVHDFIQSVQTLEGNLFNKSTGNYAVPLINYYIATKESHLGFPTNHVNPQTYTPHNSPTPPLQPTTWSWTKKNLLQTRAACHGRRSLSKQMQQHK